MDGWMDWWGGGVFWPFTPCVFSAHHSVPPPTPKTKNQNSIAVVVFELVPFFPFFLSFLPLGRFDLI